MPVGAGAGAAADLMEATSGYGSPPEVYGSGGVVWRRTGRGDYEIVLVHHSLHRDWSVPKGKQDPGEDLETCAVREVLEETGLHAQTDEELMSVHYVDRIGRPKAVSYYSMHAGDDEELHALNPTMEIDEARWVPLPDALTEVNLARDRLVLWAFAGRMGLRASDLVAPGEPATVSAKKSPLLLLRHASAGDRFGWGASDTDRPLDAKGGLQSERLAAHLASFPVERIVSSPARRCVETVEPLAAILGCPVEIDDRLGEGRGNEAPGFLRAARGRGTVACTHGDVLESALHAVATASGLPLPGSGTTKKAVTWVLNGNGAPQAAPGIGPSTGGDAAGSGPRSATGSGAIFRVAGYMAPPAL